MFAQLLITVAVSWGVAELLCRLIFGRPAHRVLRELLGVGKVRVRMRGADSDPQADVRRLLERRHDELVQSVERLELVTATAEVTRELARVRGELRQVESRLAAAGRGSDTEGSPDAGEAS